MIKSDAPVMQDAFQISEVVVSPERRAFLAQKGRLLYGKYCGTSGQGICSESFAEYHIWRGELVVVRDFLVFLKTQIESLRQNRETDLNAADQLDITQGLAERIEALLEQKAQVEQSLV
jgi:hypothetical protein